MAGAMLVSSKRRRGLVKRGALSLLIAVGLSGCGFDTTQSALNPAGTVAQIQARMITSSFWIMMVVSVVVFSALIVAIIRFRAKPGQKTLPPQTEGNNRIEFLWTVTPAIILALMMIGTINQSFVLGKIYPASQALQVDVTGHQFWWQFQYPSANITTANELHIPVGEKVELILTSADVMHSFWVPRLGGKTDLIPGRTNYMWIEASQPGIYHGQCAEFCGTGHADMRITVDAEPPARYAVWVQSMTHPVSVPPKSSTLAYQGYLDFASAGCESCHTIGGTNFAGAVGPNLTDLSDRLMIAANLIPNTLANREAWIHDPQAVKPGALMPNLHLPSNEVTAIATYLGTLK
jgi:cytochrome c oxidase subunit 2